MANPGPVDQATARTTLRVLGALLLLLGAAGIVGGAVLFARGFLADDLGDVGRNAVVGVVVFGGGGLLAGLGIAALGAGFRGSRRGYVAVRPLIITDPAGLFDDSPAEVGAPDLGATDLGAADDHPVE